MKRFVMSLIITCALSSFALAGDIPTDGIPSPAPDGSAPTAPPRSPGQIPTDGSVEQISDAALTALLTALGLLSV